MLELNIKLTRTNIYTSILIALIVLVSLLILKRRTEGFFNYNFLFKAFAKTICKPKEIIPESVPVKKIEIKLNCKDFLVTDTNTDGQDKFVKEVVSIVEDNISNEEKEAMRTKLAAILPEEYVGLIDELIILSIGISALAPKDEQEPSKKLQLLINNAIKELGDKAPVFKKLLENPKIMKILTEEVEIIETIKEKVKPIIVKYKEEIKEDTTPPTKEDVEAVQALLKEAQSLSPDDFRVCYG